jgi:hypothetical protein
VRTIEQTPLPTRWTPPDESAAGVVVNATPAPNREYASSPATPPIR